MTTCSRGTSSTCPLKTGRASRKATKSGSSSTRSAAVSPATIAQKTHPSAHRLSDRPTRPRAGRGPPSPTMHAEVNAKAVRSVQASSSTRFMPTPPTTRADHADRHRQRRPAGRRVRCAARERARRGSRRRRGTRPRPQPSAQRSVADAAALEEVRVQPGAGAAAAGAGVEVLGVAVAVGPAQAVRGHHPDHARATASARRRACASAPSTRCSGPCPAPSGRGSPTC